MPLQSSNVPDLVVIDQWLGMNQSSSRPVIDDQECFWLENFFPIAPGHLRSGWGASGALYTAPGGTSILRIFFANIDGTNPLGFMFLSNGVVDQVNLSTRAVTTIGAVWQPVAPHYWADLKLWAPNQFGHAAGQNGGVLIGSPQGLYAWDGATLTSPGQTPPLWFTGGATHDANNNPLVMPSGLPGIYAMEVYKDRLWVMGQTVIGFSAPNNGSDFSASGGGGLFPYHGDQLTVSYTELHASGGFLYLFGDSQTQGINDLTLVGQTPIQGQAGSVTVYTTNFQINNVDPQVGQRFFRPVGVWEQAFTLYNGAGIYFLANGQVQWASEKITNLLQTLDVTAFEPTQCPAHIFGKKFLLFNVKLTDPWGVSRPMILAWSGPQDQKWVVASQNLNLTNISSYEQNSVITPYGTDGTSLYQLFAQPDPHLPKRLLSKEYSGGGMASLNNLTVKDWKRLYVHMMDRFHGAEGVSITGTMTSGNGGVPGGTEDLSFNVPSGVAAIVPWPLGGKGIQAGFMLASNSPDFTLARISLTFEARTLFGA